MWPYWCKWYLLHRSRISQPLKRHEPWQHGDTRPGAASCPPKMWIFPEKSWIPPRKYGKILGKLMIIDSPIWNGFVQEFESLKWCLVNFGISHFAVLSMIGRNKDVQQVFLLGVICPPCYGSRSFNHFVVVLPILLFLFNPGQSPFCVLYVYFQLLLHRQREQTLALQCSSSHFSC